MCVYTYTYFPNLANSRTSQFYVFQILNRVSKCKNCEIEL